MKELLSYSSCSCARNYPPAKAKGHGGVTIKLLHNYKHKLDFFVEKAGCAGLEYSGPTPFATVCYTKKHVKKGHIVNYRPSNILGAGRVEVFFAH